MPPRKPRALVDSARIAGADKGDLREALAALLEARPAFLEGVAVGLAAPGRPVLETDSGALVVPTDVVDR